MAIQVIYKCDKCRKDQASAEQFWSLEVYGSEGLNHTPRPVTTPFQVCRPCLESLGIYVKKPVDAEKAAAFPTIDELIREIVSNEVQCLSAQ